MSADYHKMSFWRRYVFSLDHKVIGMQYLLTGLAMAFIGGYMAYVFRMKLAFPADTTILLYGKGFGPDKYNMFVTMHGLVMFFWVAMPVILAAFGNFLIPVMIGTDDMAFPSLNMMSYWTFLISTIIVIAAFFMPGGAFAGAWTMYPPLSVDMYANRTAPFAKTFFTGGTFVMIAVALEFVAMLMGGINFIVTTMNQRAKGLTPMRLPIYIWCVNLASVLFMFSVGPLVAGAFMLIFDRTLGTGFFDPARGGDPVLFQHLFWFFGHPEVYVVLLPALGIVGEVLTTFTRKALFGYNMIVYMLIAASVLSFVVWAHHQFVAGIDPRMANWFLIATLLISVPFAHIYFSYVATLWGGSIRFDTPMLWAIGFLLTFLVGGVTGIYLGSSAFDIYAHDTYFVVAHFHYTMIPSVFFGGLTAIYFWYPKFVGRHLNETIGKIHFYLTFIFYNSVFMPLFFNGLNGEHRRIWDYKMFPALNVQPYTTFREIATVATIGLILTQLLFLYNIFVSKFNGVKAEKNPWRSNGLEWTCDSPPPHGNFAAIPEVYRGPYEYSVPGRSSDSWPQNES